MKTKFFCISVMMLVIVTIITFKNLSKDVPFGSLALANIEALAITELTPNGWICFWDYQDDLSSPQFLIITHCYTCSSISATYAGSRSHCWFTK